MKTKHTPGPWKAKIVKGHENDLVYCAIESKSRAVAFAGVYKGKHNIDGVESQWNAKLIAAAPELLLALETIEGAFWTDGEPKSERIADLKSIAAYAIKQATS